MTWSLLSCFGSSCIWEKVCLGFMLRRPVRKLSIKAGNASEGSQAALQSAIEASSKTAGEEPVQQSAVPGSVEITVRGTTLSATRSTDVPPP